MTIEDVIEFAKKNGRGNLFTYWTEDEIRQHLCLHHRNGTLVVASEDGQIKGLLIYRRIKEFDGDVLPHFWKENEPTGKHVYIHELCSAHEHGNLTLFANFQNINRDAPELTYWAHRQLKLTRYRYKDFRRLMTCRNRNHQNHQT